MGKQQASDWKIAGIYWFLSAIVAAVLGVALSLAMSIFATRSGIITNTALFQEMIGLIIPLLGIWAGAMYAGNSVNKRYIIKNKESVTLKALIWNIVAGAVIIILLIIFGSNWTITFVGASLPLAILFGFLWISFVALFYIFTALKYIKNSD